MKRYKTTNKFIQYELWKECSIGCPFCFNRNQKEIDKIDQLNFVLDKLNDPEVDDYNEIGFIGGEFFNNELRDPKVKELFYKLFQIIKNKIEAGKVNKIYVTSALIYDRTKYLIPFLEYVRSLGISKYMLLCTSYDTAYRFRTDKMLKLWEDNMLFLHKEYPEINLHVETILTQSFINSVLNNTFNIKDFCEKFHVRMDFLEPNSGLYYIGKEDMSKDLPEFFPTESSFIEFLQKSAIDNNDVDLSTLLSMELRSCKLYYSDQGKRIMRDDRRSTDGRCISTDPTKKYEMGFIDSNNKMADIVTMMCECK